MEIFSTKKGYKKFYSVLDLSKKIHVTRAYIYKKIKTGDLVARKIYPRKEWVISEIEFERWVALTYNSLGL